MEIDEHAGSPLTNPDSPTLANYEQYCPHYAKICCQCGRATEKDERDDEACLRSGDCSHPGIGCRKCYAANKDGESLIYLDGSLPPISVAGKLVQWMSDRLEGAEREADRVKERIERAADTVWLIKKHLSDLDEKMEELVAGMEAIVGPEFDIEAASILDRPDDEQMRNLRRTYLEVREQGFRFERLSERAQETLVKLKGLKQDAEDTAEYFYHQGREYVVVLKAVAPGFVSETWG